MQPTYLPWLGYFAMMKRADLFIFLDNVQFEKGSWQSRNRIKSNSGELLLSIPVQTAGKATQLIRDTRISNLTTFPRKHIESIRINYAKAPFFNDIFPMVEQIYERATSSLMELNESFILAIRDYLGIETRIIHGSSLRANGKSTERVVNLLLEVGASEYLAATGSRAQTEAEVAFERNGLKVRYHNYDHPTYPQLHGEFLPNLSAVDLLFNCGPLSAKFFDGT